MSRVGWVFGATRLHEFLLVDLFALAAALRGCNLFVLLIGLGVVVFRGLFFLLLLFVVGLGDLVSFGSGNTLDFTDTRCSRSVGRDFRLFGLVQLGSHFC